MGKRRYACRVRVRWFEGTLWTTTGVVSLVHMSLGLTWRKVDGSESRWGLDQLTSGCLAAEGKKQKEWNGSLERRSTTCAMERGLREMKISVCVALAMVCDWRPLCLSTQSERPEVSEEVVRTEIALDHSRRSPDV